MLTAAGARRLRAIGAVRAPRTDTYHGKQRTIASAGGAPRGRPGAFAAWAIAPATRKRSKGTRAYRRGQICPRMFMMWKRFWSSHFPIGALAASLVRCGRRRSRPSFTPYPTGLGQQAGV